MAWISPNVTGPAMVVLVTPTGGVAQATFKATPPKAPATNTPANISFHLILLMVMLLRSVRGEVSHRGGPQRAALWHGLETVPQRGALLVVAVRTPDGALPLLRSDEDSGAADPSPTPQRSVAGWLFARQVFGA